MFCFDCLLRFGGGRGCHRQRNPLEEDERHPNSRVFKRELCMGVLKLDCLLRFGGRRGGHRQRNPLEEDERHPNNRAFKRELCFILKISIFAPNLVGRWLEASRWFVLY